jgi:hypothetical protein
LDFRRVQPFRHFLRFRNVPSHVLALLLRMKHKGGSINAKSLACYKGWGTNKEIPVIENIT